MDTTWTGRITGALFLSAFLLYGGGSAIADTAAGQALMLANCVAVVVIGVLAVRALPRWAARTALVYLLARLAEGGLLALGVVFLLRHDASADDTAYAVAMLALGLGSLPFCRALGRWRAVPAWLALWGGLGYAALAVGSALALAGGPASLLWTIPGGLFELILGVRLLVTGFPRTAHTPGWSSGVWRTAPAGSEAAGT